MRFLCWGTYRIWTSRRPFHTFGSAEISMVGSGPVKVLRVTLHKVGFSLVWFVLANIRIYVLVFVCVAALAILDRLDEIDQPTLSWWLAERQLPNGGLNGRPEKLEDVSSFYLCDKRVVILMVLSRCATASGCYRHFQSWTKYHGLILISWSVSFYQLKCVHHLS